MSLQFEGLSIQEKISLSLEQNSREIGLLLVIKKHFVVKVLLLLRFFVSCWMSLQVKDQLSKRRVLSLE
jgi:hypothetical protein